MLSVELRASINDLKRRLANLCCNSVLSPPLPFVEALRLGPLDSEEEKARKIQEHEEKVKMRELERVRREPEMVREMDSIVKRVFYSREETPEAEGNYTKKLIASNSTKQVNYFCEVCGNKESNYFVTDSATGDTICTGVEGSGCGNVISEHYVERGAEKRNFEGEEDRNHFGPTPDKLMPDSENMRTIIVGTKAFGSAAGTEVAFRKLNQASVAVEMNLSKIGNDDRRTRIGYKTQHKKKAFELMAQMASNYGIHPMVIERAKEEFSRYRDLKEAVQQFEGVVAACILIAYEELVVMLGSVDALAKKELRMLNEVGTTDARVCHPVPDPNDPAVMINTSKMMGKWTLTEVKAWVVGVGSNVNPVFANALNLEIESRVLAETQRNTSNPGSSSVEAVSVESTESKVVESKLPSELKKRKYPDSKLLGTAFGTTTVASRNKRSMSVSSNNSIDKHTDIGDMNAGKILIRIAVSDVFMNSQQVLDWLKSGHSETDLSLAVSVFREALRRRTVFDCTVAEADHFAEIERRRLAIEQQIEKPIVDSSSELKKIFDDGATQKSAIPQPVAVVINDIDSLFSLADASSAPATAASDLPDVAVAESNSQEMLSPSSQPESAQSDAAKKRRFVVVKGEAPKPVQPVIPRTDFMAGNLLSGLHNVQSLPTSYMNGTGNSHGYLPVPAARPVDMIPSTFNGVVGVPPPAAMLNTPTFSGIPTGQLTKEAAAAIMRQQMRAQQGQQR